MGRRPKKSGAITRLRERKKPSGKTYYYYGAGGKPRREIPLGSDYGMAIMKYAELERDREAAEIPKGASQFRDLRAKAGTDKAESSGDIIQARDQLGHATVMMTEKYVRERTGRKVTPTQ